MTQDQIAALEKERAAGPENLDHGAGVNVPAWAELQHDVVFRSDQLNAREKAAEKRQS